MADGVYGQVRDVDLLGDVLRPLDVDLQGVELLAMEVAQEAVTGGELDVEVVQLFALELLKLPFVGLTTRGEDDA